MIKVDCTNWSRNWKNGIDQSALNIRAQNRIIASIKETSSKQ